MKNSSIVYCAGQIRLAVGCVSAALLCLLLAATPARGQSTMTVSGHLTDPYGNPRPGVVITMAVSGDSGESSTNDISNAQGNYHIDIRAGTNGMAAEVVAIAAATPGHASEGQTIFSGNPGMDYHLDFSASGPPLMVGACTAGAIGQTGATLNATNNPGNLPTAACFEFGLTSRYGDRTPVFCEGGSRNLAARAKIAGLIPGTTYHFRLVAANRAGASHGPDQTFTTLPPSLALRETRLAKGEAPGDWLRMASAEADWLEFASMGGQSSGAVMTAGNSAETPRVGIAGAR